MSPTRSKRSLVELAEERDFLLRSIEDLEREHAAGDVDDTDFETLRAGYVERAAETLRLIAAAEAPPAEAPTVKALADKAPTADGLTTDGPGSRVAEAGRVDSTSNLVALSRSQRVRRRLGRRSTRRVLIPIGLVCVLGLIGVAAARAAGVRLPGATSSGSVTLTPAAKIRQELVQAELLASEGQLSNAITLYDSVLAQAPDQPEALAYKGWFLRLAGLAAHSRSTVEQGDTAIAQAVAVSPSYAEARAFYALVLAQDENAPRAAIVQFRAFLADHPSSQLVSSVADQAISTYRAEHVALPAAFARYLKTSKSG